MSQTQIIDIASQSLANAWQLRLKTRLEAAQYHKEGLTLRQKASDIWTLGNVKISDGNKLRSLGLRTKISSNKLNEQGLALIKEGERRMKDGLTLCEEGSLSKKKGMDILETLQNQFQQDKKRTQSEADKLIVRGNTQWTEGTRSRITGQRLIIDGKKLLHESERSFKNGNLLTTQGSLNIAKGDLLLSEGAKIWAEGHKVRSDGSELLAESDRMKAEADIAFMQSVINTYGNVAIEWNENFSKCMLENGEIYE